MRELLVSIRAAIFLLHWLGSPNYITSVPESGSGVTCDEPLSVFVFPVSGHFSSNSLFMHQ